MAAHDSDPFNRWQAVQTLASTLLVGNVARLRAGQDPEADEGLLEALDAILAQIRQSEPSVELRLVDKAAIRLVRQKALQRMQQFQRRKPAASAVRAGGWLPPYPIAPLTWIPGVVWFVLKASFVFFMFAMVKAFVPRYRYDQLMRLGWKVFLPLSLVMVVVVAGILQYGPAQWVR